MSSRRKPAPGTAQDAHNAKASVLTKAGTGPLVGVIPEAMLALAGSKSEDFSVTLLREVLGALSITADELPQRVRATAAAIRAFQPQDEVEAMLAAQALAMHAMTMECARRAMLDGQDAEIKRGLRRSAASS